MAKRNKVIPIHKDNDIKNTKVRTSYRQTKSKILSFTLNETQQAEAAKLYEMTKNILLRTFLDEDANTRKMLIMAQGILGHIEFDIDAGSRPLEKAVNNSNIRGKIQTYLNTLS